MRINGFSFPARVLAGVALLAAAVSLAPAPARAAQPGLVTDLTWGISDDDQERVVAALEDVGSRWVRVSIQWKAWEPSRGSFDAWQVHQTDRAVDLCRAAGINVLLDVLNAPAWASPTNDSGLGNVPRSPADFAAFVETVASRYRGKVQAYEIWNEPDIRRFWNPGPNAAAYTALLKAAYPAVKRADPDALVVSGGLSWDYTNFLGGMYANGAKGFFDVLAVHPYPVSTLARWQASYREARETQLAHGDPKPIWFTEFGFNTGSDPDAWQPGVNEQAQALRVQESFALLEEDPYVEVAFYYNFRNNWWSHDDPTSMEANFGLLRTNFTPKPAYYAFQDVARSGAGAPGPVALVAPRPGATFRNSLPLSAVVAEGQTPTSVEFRVDGELLATDAEAPYGLTWAVPAALPLGAHAVTATVMGSEGSIGTDSAVVVRVPARTRTTVRVASRRWKRLVAAGFSSPLLRVSGRVHGSVTQGRVRVRFSRYRPDRQQWGAGFLRSARVEAGRYGRAWHLGPGRWRIRVTYLPGVRGVTSSRSRRVILFGGR